MIHLIIPEPNSQLSVQELCYCANISENFLLELVEHNIAVPASGVQVHEWLFTVNTLNLVKKATRIHRDLAIDLAGISLVLNLLDDIEKLKSENATLKRQLSRFILSENDLS